MQNYIPQQKAGTTSLARDSEMSIDANQARQKIMMKSFETANEERISSLEYQKLKYLDITFLKTA